MKVKQLKEIIEQLDDEQEIFFRPYRSNYVYDFSFNMRSRNIQPFLGDEIKAQVIDSCGQVGSI